MATLRFRRRRRKRARQKSNHSLNKQNNNSARASRFFVHFFVITARLQPEILIFRLMEDVNKRPLNFLSSSELNSRSVRLHLTN